MNKHLSAPIRMFLMVLAVVLFFIAAVGWPAPVDPWRLRLVAAGLFCWSLSQFF